MKFSIHLARGMLRVLANPCIIMSKFKIRSLVLLSFVAALTGGCFAFMGHTTNTRATSLMDFLYPNEAQHVDTPGPAVLSLPLRVGIAFVPPARSNNGYNAAPLTEEAKAELLKRVADEFKALPYVKNIEIIPTTYLRPGGGFVNLNQLKNFFDVDVITLVAYDQTQFTDEGLLTLTYWTIVGAYLVPAERNDTQTLMEAAVYDIKSRKLLFRAPGLSEVKGGATPVNATEQLRSNSREGFDKATTELIANLKNQLEDFKTKAKDAPEEFQIEHKPGYTGGGALDGGFALAIAGLAMGQILRRKSA